MTQCKSYYFDHFCFIWLPANCRLEVSILRPVRVKLLISPSLISPGCWWCWSLVSARSSLLGQIQARIAASVSQSLELFCRLQKGDQNQPGIGSRLLHKICVVSTEYQQYNWRPILFYHVRIYFPKHISHFLCEHKALFV